MKGHPASRLSAPTLACLIAAAALPAAAEPGIALTATDAPLILGDIVVTATRTATDSASVPATISAIDRAALDRGQPRDAAEVFADEPDIAMSRDMRRFGATRINIRGIEDNRVLQMVDGIRSPDYYDGSGPSNFTISTPLGTPTAFLRQVEILRGPASSLYGSDAIGGVVGYLTLDPNDLIAPDRNSGIRYQSGYNEASSAWHNTLLGAFRSEAAELLLGYTQEEGHGTDNRGSVGGTSKMRSKPDPKNFRDKGGLAKLILHPSEQHQLSLTLETREQRVNTDVKRLSASPTTVKVTQMAGEDLARRQRGSIEWRYLPTQAFFDQMTARFYYQAHDTHNLNQQTRSNTGATCSAQSGAGNLCHVEQRFRFRQDNTGASLQFESNTGWWEKEHRLSYGIDLIHGRTTELRDSDSWNLTTGSHSKSLAGDTFPLRDFANGRTDSAGLFLQDEIHGWANGRLTLTPGLRYDWRKIRPDVDALAEPVLLANDSKAVTQSDAALSPKIAALWQVDAHWSLYGQLVRGFRAPDYKEVNSSFRNTIQSYGISPNSDLKPETSIGLELGAKLHAQTMHGQFAVFDNRYKNFIEFIELSCPTDPGCIAGLARTNRYVNLSRVRIYGAELRGAWDFTPGWKLDGAIAWSRGENRSDHQPLNSIEPARASIGLLRDAGRWGVETRLRAALAVSRSDDRKTEWYHPPGYAVAGINAWWRPNASSVLNVSVNNLFNKKYWLWSDIRQADSESPLGVDFYSQPGRTLAASFTYDF